MSETPRTGDRDPIKWVNTAQRVEAHYAIGDDVAAVGKVVSYCDAPTVTIETDDGRRVSWRVDLTNAVEKTAETGAEYVFRSNLRGDGAAFLSLHRLGDDVHLRLRHVTSEPLAFEVAVLSPSERRALITALSEFDAEPPARMSVRVPNEPHGLSHETRVKISAFLASGNKESATVIAHDAGMDWQAAAAYVEDMSEDLSTHGEKRQQRDARVFSSDGPEPPDDIECLLFSGVYRGKHDVRFLKRSVDLQRRWVWVSAPTTDVTAMVGECNWPPPLARGSFTEVVS